MNARIELVQQALQRNGWDALVCALPSNVLMMCGYWPVVGTGVAVMSADGNLKLLVPKDEESIAGASWASEIRTFKPGSLDDLQTPSDCIHEPLSRLLRGCTSIGFEACAVSEPSSYVAMNLYSGGMAPLLERACPAARLRQADGALAQLKSVKTAEEIEAIRKSAKAAGEGFRHGAEALREGISEVRAADTFLATMRDAGMQSSVSKRAGGHYSCMSGQRSAQAFGAFARSTTEQIGRGDLVLTHCNTQVDGYWTDITRTFVMGEFTTQHRDMYDAVFAAREAAVAVLQPGVAANAVDRAARDVMNARGFGKVFKHAAGHGVGFGAIDTLSLPRLHPKAPDRIEVGMTFNLEPAVYVENAGGVRHCDMFVMTASGAELLTPFLSLPGELRK